ncbi:hypothetical protein MCOR25_010648 [Pyricularia grisea]|uniref:Uncharacterized protein n=1 Tax=Pyricularia grisea TaxID=148305 RepID=A0A6P8AMD6_PYRGI
MTNRGLENTGDILILPLKYAEDLFKLPERIANQEEHIRSRLESKILKITSHNDFLLNVLRSDLNQQLPRLNQVLSDAAHHRVLEILKEPTDGWTEFAVLPAMTQISIYVLSNVFVGPELARNPEWLDISVRFTKDLFGAAHALKRYPQFLRPLAKYRCPEAMAVVDDIRKVSDLLKPIISARQEWRDKGAVVEQDDFVHMTVNKAPKWKHDNLEFLVHTELQVVMASLNNTSASLVHFLYDITALCPQVIPELRAEIQSALEKTNGAWSSSALFNMKLLDSVMKESLRFNPNLMITPRKLKKAVRLSDGTELPAGVNVCIAGYGALQDGEFYKHPAKFDPYRFLKLRTGEVEDPLHHSNPEQYQFVSTTKQNMTFGYGVHACPGRFVANTVMKMIIGNILIHYDIKLPDWVQGRYQNIMHGHFISPDPSKTLMIRKRND